jgi:hypothetical protein
MSDPLQGSLQALTEQAAAVFEVGEFLASGRSTSLLLEGLDPIPNRREIPENETVQHTKSYLPNRIGVLELSPPRVGTFHVTRDQRGGNSQEFVAIGTMGPELTRGFIMKSHNIAKEVATELPIYFVSNRPEAYEYWGEVSRERAEILAKIIAEHASSRFPGIDFRIDSEWHAHDPRTANAAMYIEKHWLEWARACRESNGT